VFPEYVDKAINSVKGQTFQDIELIVLDNKERTHSIGRMFNQGAELASADWVYFLGDDDFVSPDYFASLKMFIDRYAIEEKYVAVSSYSIFFDDEKKVMSTNAMTPMGAFRRDYLLSHKFNEDLEKYIDVDYYKRLDADGKKAKIMRWHFGYYYRQHDGNVSGRKIIKELSNHQHGDNVSGRENIKPIPLN